VTLLDEKNLLTVLQKKFADFTPGSGSAFAKTAGPEAQIFRHVRKLPDY
jgi:hypothetical protein